VRFERRSPGQYGKTVTRTHALARTTPLSQHITLPILARTALVSSHPSVAMHLASLYVGAHAQRHARNKAFLSKRCGFQTQNGDHNTTSEQGEWSSGWWWCHLALTFLLSNSSKKNCRILLVGAHAHTFTLWRILAITKHSIMQVTHTHTINHLLTQQAAPSFSPTHEPPRTAQSLVKGHARGASQELKID
jgi:hypothetical protein